MPADRTKRSRRAETDASQHESNSSVEAFGGGITFAPTATPLSWVDSEVTVERKGAQPKKKQENHVPRPPNAFILFRSSFIKNQHVSTEVETNHSTLSKIIGLTWQNLPLDQREVWHAKAKAALDEHKRKFPEYAFRPAHNGGGKGGTPKEKRKVREVGLKDLKRCQKIAELLVEGKKGQELDAAIQEFDKSHVPEVVTRFDTPITERAFRRRSSSVPLPGAEDSKEGRQASGHRSSRRSYKARISAPRLKRSQTTDSISEPPSSPIEDFSSPAFMAEQSSFDFNSFSFDNVSSSVPIVTCDPLSQSASPLNEADMYSQEAIYPPSSPESAYSIHTQEDVYPIHAEEVYPPYPQDEIYAPASPQETYSPHSLDGLYSPSSTEEVYPPFAAPAYDTYMEGWGQCQSPVEESVPSSPTDGTQSYYSQYSYDAAPTKDTYYAGGNGGIYYNIVQDYNPPIAGVDVDLAGFFPSAIPQYTM